ncbi:RNA-binding domain-containing protein [Parabacteroides goldsteinii]|uniref:RNA-binding domain-containing protein n=1 Tax=Parabacteroides goldsteinii TaxID=328812 RepID=UPI003AB8AD98
MNSKELQLIVKCGETSTVQFKERFSNQDSIAAEMVAMSNARGGMILFGIRDKTGEIIGLSYQEIQQINSMLANIATNLLRPVIYIQTETIIIEDRSILVAHIDEGDNKPYKDLGGAIWIKQGSDKRKVMENSEIIRLFQCSGMLYADEQPIPFTSDRDVNSNVLDEFVRKEYGREIDTFGIPYTELLQNLNIVRDGKMTLAGLLFFGKNPQQYRPTFVIKAVAFWGNDIAGISYRDSKDISGTLPEIFDKGMSFLKANLRNIQAGQGFNSIGKLEVSEIALEEILQNALVHRDYTKNAPVRLLIFDNRIEIISPGCLPDGLTVENIKFGNAVVRNPFIANFCAKTMPYRGLGSGIIRALKEEPNLKLINDFDGVQFISVIERPYNEGINEGINEIETLILTFLEKNPGIKVKDISKYINKGIATTERYIKSLKEKGLVVYVGARKTGGYYKK